MKLDGIMYWVADPTATAAFYEKAFGLTVQMTDDTGSYVQMTTGETTLAFAAESAATANSATIAPSRAGQPAAPVQLAFVADDVEAAFATALAGGCTEIAPIVTKPWGQRLGYVADLNGFLVELSSPAAW